MTPPRQTTHNTKSETPDGQSNVRDAPTAASPFTTPSNCGAYSETGSSNSEDRRWSIFSFSGNSAAAKTRNHPHAQRPQARRKVQTRSKAEGRRPQHPQHPQFEKDDQPYPPKGVNTHLHVPKIGYQAAASQEASSRHSSISSVSSFCQALLNDANDVQGGGGHDSDLSLDHPPNGERLVGRAKIPQPVVCVDGTTARFRYTQRHVSPHMGNDSLEQGNVSLTQLGFGSDGEDAKSAAGGVKPVMQVPSVSYNTNTPVPVANTILTATTNTPPQPPQFIPSTYATEGQPLPPVTTYYRNNTFSSQGNLPQLPVRYYAPQSNYQTVAKYSSGAQAHTATVTTPTEPLNPTVIHSAISSQLPFTRPTQHRESSPSSAYQSTTLSPASHQLSWPTSDFVNQPLPASTISQKVFPFSHLQTTSKYMGSTYPPTLGDSVHRRATEIPLRTNNSQLVYPSTTSSPPLSGLNIPHSSVVASRVISSTTNAFQLPYGMQYAPQVNRFVTATPSAFQQDMEARNSALDRQAGRSRSTPPRIPSLKFSNPLATHQDDRHRSRTVTRGDRTTLDLGFVGPHHEKEVEKADMIAARIKCERRAARKSRSKSKGCSRGRSRNRDKKLGTDAAGEKKPSGGFCCSAAPLSPSVTDIPERIESEVQKLGSAVKSQLKEARSHSKKAGFGFGELKRKQKEEIAKLGNVGCCGETDKEAKARKASGKKKPFEWCCKSKEDVAAKNTKKDVQSSGFCCGKPKKSAPSKVMRDIVPKIIIVPSSPSFEVPSLPTTKSLRGPRYRPASGPTRPEVRQAPN